MKAQLAQQAYSEVESNMELIKCELVVNDFQAAADKAYPLLKSVQKLKQILERNEKE